MAGFSSNVGLAVMETLLGILVLCHYALVDAVTGNKASELTSTDKAAPPRAVRTVSVGVIREADLTPELKAKRDAQIAE